MEAIGEMFIELVYRKIIVGIFGYYTLLAFYKITKNEEALNQLNAPAAHAGEEFSRGCLINIVGIITFCAFITLIVYLFF